MSLMISIHSLEGRISVTIADKELTNKVIKDKNSKKKINLTSKFYNWKNRKEEDIKPTIKDAKLILFIGEKAISFGIDNRLIEQKDIQKIEDIPFCHFLKI